MFKNPTEEKAQSEIDPKSLREEAIKFRDKNRYKWIIKRIISVILCLAAVALVAASIFMPVLEISGDSMAPTLSNKDIVVCVNTSKLQRGDLCGLYYNNHVLVKRVIGVEGDVITIDDDGNVSVNGEVIDEPYVSKKMKGECDVEFPYTVPPNTVFVLGDNRAVSMDSRNSMIGCVSLDEIVGKIVFRVWPLGSFGAV